jgi:small ligand-binding sensory domain FIST
MTSSPASPCYASALSVLSDPRRAAAQACQQATAELGGSSDLAFLFLSADAADAADEIAADVCNRLGTEKLIGCTGEAIVGRGQEVEDHTAVSLWLAKLPGANVQPIHLTFRHTPEGPSILGWPDRLLDGWPAEPCLLLLGDPFSFPADFLLQQTNDLHPDATVIGGMASGPLSRARIVCCWAVRCMTRARWPP